MILITVGTEKFPFNRLMQWIDELISQDLIQPEKEEVVIQYGSCTVVPSRTRSHSILQQTDFLSLVNEARIIIAHCGEGTIDLLALTNRPFILVPRSYDFQEHVDDHQIELARQLTKLGIPIANSKKDLVDFIAQPFTVQFPVTPAKYYAKASLLLENEFETDFVKEDLISKLIGSWQLIPGWN